MQNFHSYKLSDILDKSKKFKIINFYSGKVMYEGSYEDMPDYLRDATYRIFTPYPDYFEFIT